MERFAMAVALGLGLLLAAGQADAQWRYTDDKGASRVTQYKIDVPEPHRDAAEWIGPVGIGKPALSADQVRAAQLCGRLPADRHRGGRARAVPEHAGPGAAGPGSGRAQQGRWRPCASRASSGS